MRILYSTVYRIADELFLVVVEPSQDGRSFDAHAFRLAGRTRAQVVHPDGAPMVSSAQMAWQATARMAHQLETYLRSIALELRNYDTSRYNEDIGVWHVPA